MKHVQNMNRLRVKQYIHEESCLKIYYKDLSDFFSPFQQSRNKQNKTLKEKKSEMQPTDWEDPKETFLFLSFRFFSQDIAN